MASDADKVKQILTNVEGDVTSEASTLAIREAISKAFPDSIASEVAADSSVKIDFGTHTVMYQFAMPFD